MTTHLSLSRTDGMLIVGLLAACSPVLAAYGPVDGSGPAVVLAALLSWAPIALASVLLVAAMTRWWISAAVTAIVLVAHIALLLPLAVGSNESGSEPVVVMTANIYFGLADPVALVGQVRSQRVDVLAVQELTPEAARALSVAGLDSVLPYSLIDAAPSSRGTGLWASRPLTRAPAWRTTFRSTAGVTTIEGRKITMMTLHPVPPNPTDTEGWHRDYARLQAAADADPNAGRTVLLGDMNASVHHRVLRELMGRRWRDAAEVAGAGLVRTWSPTPRLPGGVRHRPHPGPARRRSAGHRGDPRTWE